MQGSVRNLGRSEANLVEDSERRAHQIAKTLREEILKGKFSFPMLSQSALRVLQASQDQSLSLRELQQVIAQDQMIALRVLHCANSSIYAAQYPTSSLRAAAMRLGVVVLREIMARAVAESVLFQDGPTKILAGEQKHAIATATLARAASELIDVAPETGYICGLLHNIGRPILWGRLYSKGLRDEIRSLGVPAAEEIVDLLHPLVGERVLRSWSLPPLIAEVARFHHCYRGTNHGVSNKPMICIIAAADRLAQRLISGEENWQADFMEDPAVLELDLGESNLRIWMEYAASLPSSFAD